MNPQPSKPPVLFPVALILLAGVALIMALAKVQVRELEDELRIARERRAELEERVRQRDAQLDQLLDHMRDGDDKPAGE